MLGTIGRRTTPQREIRLSVDDIIEKWRATHPPPLRVQRAAVRRSKRRRWSALLLLLIAGLTSLAMVQTGVIAAPSCIGTSSSPRSSHRIALIDSLALDDPNTAFVDNITSFARQAGYVLDYYPPEAATLDLLIHLPEKGYGIIIFRSHGVAGSAVIVTSIGYSQYAGVGNQLKGELAPARVNQRLSFALMPSFITGEMCGQFPGTLVLAMGCFTTGGNNLSKAFVAKGAVAFIGWNGWVTLSHTDPVFSHLTQLLLSGTSFRQAVDNTMNTVGPDLQTGSTLTYYPP